MPLQSLLSDTDMANIVMSEEGYSFNYEWIAAGSGIGEEICGMDKDCIIVPTSPVLPKLQMESEEVDDYVEIQVTEEEVIADQWNTHNSGSEVEVEVDSLGFNVDPHDDDIVSIPEQDEYSRLHPYPCDFCSQRFSKKSSLTAHMVTHQEKPYHCNMCGAQYHHRQELTEHMKIHAYAPIKEEPDDDYDDFPPLPPSVPKPKQKVRRKKRIKKYEYSEKPYQLTREKKFRSSADDILDSIKFEIDLPQEEIQKFPIIDPSRPYVCQHCGVGFAREKALTSHNMVHVGDQAFECESCGDMFQSDEQLEQHIAVVHSSDDRPTKQEDNEGGGTFLCNECGMSFQWYNQLRKHRKTHFKDDEDEDKEEDEGHLCTLCNIVFNTLEELLCHKQDHDPDIGVHSCSICGEVYESMVELRQHMRVKHKANHLCPFCEKMFKDDKALTRHLATHSDTRSSYPCNICSRKFYTKTKLKKHMVSHVEVNNRTQGSRLDTGMLCRECGMEFTDAQLLLNHRQHVHGVNISRMFPCLQCGKAFNSRSSHQIHVRIHTGERPYGCKYCWKAFGDGGTLRKHERIHTGEKPYVCPVCSKAFNQRVVLREHIRAHHSGAESKLSDNCFECIVCGTVLHTSSDLCAHLVLHSDENTAKHRTPKGNRKYVRKKRLTPPGFDEGAESGSTGEDDRRKFHSPIPSGPVQPVLKFSDDIEPLIKIDPDLIETSPSSDSKGRARIVRSGRKGMPKGQNKRYIRGKTKAARLLNNTSYASKYVVSRPEDSDVYISQEATSPPPMLNGIGAPRSRPRTKNVSYHNMRAEGPRYELATFPIDNKKTPTSRKKVQVKRESPPDPIENQYVNGIDLFNDASGEQIETCIVDDIDVELKLEVKTSENEECFIGSDIALKTEFVACDMCSEIFTSRSDLLKHIQIHI